MKNIKELLRSIVVSGKKIIAGSMLIVMASCATTGQKKEADVKSERKKKISEFVADDGIEKSFKNSPYLFQKYSGNISQYRQEFNDAADKYVNGSEKKDPTDNAKIKDLDKAYCQALCGEVRDCEWKNLSFIEKTKDKQKSGIDAETQVSDFYNDPDVYLARNKDAYIQCNKLDGYIYDLLQTDVCEDNKDCSCEAKTFDKETMYSCKTTKDNENKDNRNKKQEEYILTQKTR